VVLRVTHEVEYRVFGNAPSESRGPMWKLKICRKICGGMAVGRQMANEEADLYKRKKAGHRWELNVGNPNPNHSLTRAAAHGPPLGRLRVETTKSLYSFPTPNPR
jgi:hypothetical protein